MAYVPVSELQNKAHPLGQETSGPGSHFDIHLRSHGISRRFFSEVLNGTAKEKQLNKKNTDFIINMKVIQILAGKPGKRPAHAEGEQIFSCNGALSCGKSD